MAMIRRTGGEDFPDKLKALVTGPPKSGKTTLLGTVPNIIIADTEPKANNLASLAHLNIPYVTIERGADLRELLMVLSNENLRAQAAASAGMPSIDAVAIDTLDTLQKILKRERMEDQRSTKFVRDDWAWMKEEMTKIVEAFTALPLHVIFTVHIGSKNVGTEDNPNVKAQPGLEGAIAQELPGMVGYSLRSFRKEEFDAVSNKKYTKYWLQAEGDEVYDFLGTRTAGRLPSVIEPDFGTIYKAAMAGRPTNAAPAPAQMPAPPAAQPSQQQPQQVQTPVQSQQPQQAVEQAGPDSGPTQQPQQVPQQGGQPPAEKPADDQPINDVALQHIKRVYDACQLGFPEQRLRQLTLGDARMLVKMWQAIQADHAEGKAQEGATPVTDMVAYLQGQNLLPGEGEGQSESGKAITPKLEGTIEEVKAWVGDGSDLARVNQAFEVERTGKNRKSLMEWLESKGASHGGSQAPQEALQAVPTDVQSDVQQAAQAPQQQPQQVPDQAPAGVTPTPPPADAPLTEEEAVNLVRDELGGVPIGQEANPEAAMCEAEGEPHRLDDLDIAKLANTRFNQRLCVQHYIARTKG